MTSTIPDADAVNWIIGPAGRCVSYIVEETRVAAILHRSLIVLSGLDPFLRLARRSLDAAGKSNEGMDLLLAEQRTLGPWAKELLDVKLHPINSHALIGLWTAVEVAMEDTVTLILINDSEALEKVMRAGVRWQRSTATGIDEQAARRIYTRFERLTREARSVGEAYCQMLSSLDIRLSLHEETLTTLAEMNYVRNCFLHRGGIADQRIVVEAPKLGLQSGQKIAVTSDHYLRYFTEVGKFSDAFLTATIGSKYVRTKTSGLSS